MWSWMARESTKGLGREDLEEFRGTLSRDRKKQSHLFIRVGLAQGLGGHGRRYLEETDGWESTWRGWQHQSLSWLTLLSCSFHCRLTWLLLPLSHCSQPEGALDLLQAFRQPSFGTTPFRWIFTHEGTGNYSVSWGNYILSLYIDTSSF